MDKKTLTLTNASDHGFSQLESVLDQFRRKAMGEATIWSLATEVDPETGASRLVLDIAGKPKPQ